MDIKVIGCGGIGSFFAAHIDKLIDLKQFHEDWKFTFYDDDVVELKNILYQNFETSDIDTLKTIALSYRYFNIRFESKRLNIKDLKKCDLVILCADNNLIRQEAWENWNDNKIPFIDSRANGKAVGIFTNETKDYEKTIDKSTASSSCQNPFQLAKKEIEYGNVIIAAVLAQTLLGYARNKRLPNNIMLNV
jgi:molybdopterin/thiamine biosynthesis adenylyltransferase